MSYQGYNQNQQGYGSYNPYGQSGNPNPYAQGQGNPYAQQGNQYSQPSSNQYAQQEYGQGQGHNYGGQQQQGYEMSNLGGNDPNRILNECRAIDRAIDEVEADLQTIRGLQRSFLSDPDASPNSPLGQRLDQDTNDVKAKYRSLVNRVKKIKSDPESGNPRNAPQVGKVDRRLKTTINQFQQNERDYRKEAEAQMARQYRIVRPDASDAEVREAVESPNQQIFSQALINADRRGQAQSVAQNVRSRHQAIQKIEQDMIELAQLFQDLETAVIQQEPAVAQIEQRGEEVTEHVAKANTELDGAVKKARAARRKKWYCLGIVVLILIIIAIVLAVVFGRK